MRLLYLLSTIVVVAVVAVTEDETIDEQISEVLQNDGVKVSPIIELADGKFLYDLDEVFTREQFQYVFGDKLEKKNRGVSIRAAATRSYRWSDNVFPYVLDSSYGSRDRDLVLKSMRELEEGTCMKFKRRSRERNYVQFINGGGCYSMLGMIGRGMQKLSLSKSGCRWRATVLHEILHALGVIHEQERPDRDKHVRINSGNMMRGTASQFEKARSSSINNYGVPYDFSSVMHYGLTSFSRNGRRTIEPKNEKNAEKYIGRQLHSGLSFGDFKLINQMYDCASRCNVDCPQPGYLTKECECVQKADFYKKNCQGGEKSGWCYKYTVEKGSGTGTGTGGGSSEDNRCSECRALKKFNKCTGLK